MKALREERRKLGKEGGGGWWDGRAMREVTLLREREREEAPGRMWRRPLGKAVDVGDKWKNSEKKVNREPSAAVGGAEAGALTAANVAGQNEDVEGEPLARQSIQAVLVAGETELAGEDTVSASQSESGETGAAESAAVAGNTRIEEITEAQSFNEDERIDSSAREKAIKEVIRLKDEIDRDSFLILGSIKKGAEWLAGR